MPLNFYGKVVDEKDQPIIGARIQFIWTDLSTKGSSNSESITDTKGQFSLKGKTGKFLEVDIRKEGYYRPKEVQLAGFEYADFSSANYNEPDPNKPVIFHLRKIATGEQLVTGEVDVITSPDGTPERVDLMNRGSVSPDGQLEISAVTNTEKYPPRYFDWRATLSMRNGGMLEHSDEFPFEAPAAGYTPQEQFNYPMSDTAAWQRVVSKNYYITFGSPPKYGRIEISINGGSQHVDVRYWINPSGSRNLEPSQPQPVPQP